MEEGRFFKTIFLLTETSMDVVHGIFFVILSNIDVKFDAKKLRLRKYTITKTIPIARQIKQINKYEFVEVALNKASEIFVLYVAALEASALIITVQSIRKLLLAALE